MPMKNLSVRRPLWSSTQKFRHSQDSRSMLAIPVDGGKREGKEVRCSGIERDWEEGEGGREGRRETAVPTRRYEGMDLDLKGGTQRGRRGWKDRRLVEQLASRQWHSGWQEPYNLLPSPPSPFSLSSPSPISSLSTNGSYVCILVCLTQLARETDTRYP